MEGAERGENIHAHTHTHLFDSTASWSNSASAPEACASVVTTERAPMDSSHGNGCACRIGGVRDRQARAVTQVARLGAMRRK
eukprot:1482002-Pyramimonas_sp.AAC.1